MFRSRPKLRMKRNWRNCFKATTWPLLTATASWPQASTRIVEPVNHSTHQGIGNNPMFNPDVRAEETRRKPRHPESRPGRRTWKNRSPRSTDSRFVPGAESMPALDQLICGRCLKLSPESTRCPGHRSELRFPHACAFARAQLHTAVGFRRQEVLFRRS